MLASMIFPLVQLVILGNAFGGKIRDARLAIVDQDGTQALKIRGRLIRCAQMFRTFVPIYYDSQKQAVEDVRNGKLEGAVIIPRSFRDGFTKTTTANRGGGGQQRQLYEFRD